MKRIPHPTPYKVSWLNKGQKFLVNEQTWVEFNIRCYKDKILCDIIPMDVCHLLLGRPQKYDRKAKHDGQKNIYVIDKDGVSFTLTPLQDEEFDKQVGSSVMVVGEKQFLKTLKDEGGQGFYLVIRPKSASTLAAKKVKGIPSEVQALLDKYKYIAVDELPSYFPPMRDVSHHIDLIPSVKFPKKAAYKMTPKKNEEMRRQVQELLEA